MLNLLLVEVWVKISVIAAIVLIFFIITVLNIKTKKPADCIDEDSKCNTCLMNCIHNTNKNIDEQDPKQ